MEFLDSTRDPTPAGAILFLQELNQRKITGEPPKKQFHVKIKDI